MPLLSNLAVSVLAAEHVYIMILEMFLWTTPRGLKAFGLKKDFAEKTKTLAANQGLVRDAYLFPFPSFLLSYFHVLCSSTLRPFLISLHTFLLTIKSNHVLLILYSSIDLSCKLEIKTRANIILPC